MGDGLAQGAHAHGTCSGRSGLGGVLLGAEDLVDAARERAAHARHDTADAAHAAVERELAEAERRHVDR